MNTKTINVSAWLRGLGQLVAWMFVAVLTAAFVLENWHKEIFAAMSIAPSPASVHLGRNLEEAVLEPLHNVEAEFSHAHALTTISRPDFYLLQGVEEITGVDSQLLNALYFDESTCGRFKYGQSGEQGGFQFMPATWAEHGIDGDGDGHADPFSTIDAAFSAANYLVELGYHDNPWYAVYRYKGGVKDDWSGRRNPDAKAYANRTFETMARLRG